MSRHKHIYLQPKDAYHLNGYASFLLYKKRLVLEEGNNHYHWLVFRYLYLTQYKDAFGSLWCSYCDRRNLNIIGSNKDKQTATIEHVNPLVCGGSRYDLANLSIACPRCNNRRGSKRLTNDQRSRLRHRAQVEQRLLRFRRRPSPDIVQIRTDYSRIDIRETLRKFDVKVNGYVMDEISSIPCPF
jgi:5-methylcytosine-specific restriction endonuclease McrA